MTGNTATTTQASDHTNPRTTAIRQGRQADSARRRQRVIAVLGRAATDGTEISASGIARAAGVDRSFLYRHRDLLEKIHAPPRGHPAGHRHRRTRSGRDPRLPAGRPARRRRTSPTAQQPNPATGKAPVRNARRNSLAGIRSRCFRRYRRSQPNHQPPRTTGHRPAPTTRRTRPGPRRRARREPRTHRPAQHRATKPVTRRTPFVHNTCRGR